MCDRGRKMIYYNYLGLVIFMIGIYLESKYFQIQNSFLKSECSSSAKERALPMLPLGIKFYNPVALL
jgi:hypothetical protein